MQGSFSPPVVHILGCRLVGELTDGISLLVYLTDVDASSNNFTGPVGAGLFFLPQLARLNLANNNFTGNLDQNLG